MCVCVWMSEALPLKMGEGLPLRERGEGLPLRDGGWGESFLLLS